MDLINHLGLAQACEVLGLSRPQLQLAVDYGLLSRDPGTRSFDPAQLREIVARPEPFHAALTAAREARVRSQSARRSAQARDREAARRRQAELRRAAAARVRARVPARALGAAPPERAVLHLGPPRSGRTRAVVEVLAAHPGTGVYATARSGHALEAYGLLRARLGPEQVGLTTDRGSVNGRARVLCCTDRHVRPTGDVLVVDSVEGDALARLLLAGAHRTVHVTGVPRDEALLGACLAGSARLDIAGHRRAAPLPLVPAAGPGEVPPGTAVVARDRACVHALHRELLAAGRTATVLYESLPSAVRLEQLRRLAAGEVDVVVTTPVLGRDPVPPLASVRFAQAPEAGGWETARLAAYADGTVGEYRTAVPVTPPGRRLLRDAVEAAADGGAAPGRGRLPLLPAWEDLGGPAPGEIPHALAAWRAAAAGALAGHHGLYAQWPVALTAKWQAARTATGSGPAADAPWPADGPALWRLLTLPGGPDGLFPRIAAAFLAGRSLTGLLRPLPDIALLSLPDAESYAGTLRELRSALLRLGDFGGLSPADTAAGETAVVRRLNELLAQGEPLSPPPVCACCGASCAPWEDHCGQCRCGGGPPRARGPE
jgi:ATP-dependent RNA helicase SUPV3L1/SUV3